MDSLDLQSHLDSLINDYGVDPELIFNGVSRESKTTKAFSALELINIANNLNIDAVSLSRGEFCKSQVVKKLNSQDHLITPDHLLESAYSSTTSLNTLLEEAERFGRREYLLKKLQVDESYLKEHRPLSVFACRKALDIMGPFFDKNVLRSLGRSNARKFCLGPFGEAMTSFDTVSNSLESFMANCKLIEKNWDYKLVKRKATSFIVESTESDLMQEHLKGETFTTASLNTWRWSFLEEVIRINSGKNATCVETEASPGNSIVEVFIQ